MTRCLVVNADDFGRTPGVSRGILEAHLIGIVTSTTVMVNLPGAAQAVRQALVEAPQLAIGVHLNLTHGRPVLPPEQLPGLVSSKGTFRPYPELCAAISELSPDVVRREWEAQIRAVQDLGATVDHLDSHHFVAELTPALWENYLDFARQYRLGARGPRPPKVGHQQILPPAPETQGLSFSTARAKLIASGVPSSDGLRVDFFGEDANQELLLSLLKGLPEGVTELMVHPAIVDAELLASSSYTNERQAELAVLTSETTRHAVLSGGIRLTRYADALVS
jgi:predicted glycoside hydrolase/deacetylase ChbG (UPF0249 family)